MPSEFETGYVVRTPAWHGLASVLDEPLTAAEALVEAGQDWTVLKAPLRATFPDGSEGELTDFMATYRDDTRGVLGVVGKGWTPVQNADAFAFLDELVGGGELLYESCGVLAGGKKVYMVARHPEFMELAAGEQIKRYLLVWNGHAGTLAFGVKRVNERVVCANTLSLAMREEGATFRARHTAGVEYRTMEAREVLGMAFAHDEQFERMATELIETPMSSREEGRFVERLVPLRVTAKPDSRAARNAAEARAAVLAIIRDGPDLENVRGTAWAALQAATEYSDWRPVSGSSGRKAAEARFRRNWIEDAPIKVRALALLAPQHLPARTVKAVAADAS